jgi:hypothetical protein
MWRTGIDWDVAVRDHWDVSVRDQGVRAGGRWALVPSFLLCTSRGGGSHEPGSELRHRPFMSSLPKWTVDYCMFGAPYRKRADLFLSDNMREGLSDILCDKTCGQVDKSGRHMSVCQNGPSNRKPGASYIGKLDSRHSVPPALCVGILIKIQSIISNREASDVKGAG